MDMLIPPVSSPSVLSPTHDTKRSPSTKSRHRRRDTKEFREKMHSLRHKLRAHGYRSPAGMDLKREFEDMDSNNDGTLSRDEFRHCVKRLIPISDEDMVELSNVLDRNGDGMITYSEFLIFVQNQHDPTEDSRVVSTLLLSSNHTNGDGDGVDESEDRDSSESVEKSDGILMLTSGSDGGKFLFG